MYGEEEVSMRNRVLEYHGALSNSIKKVMPASSSVMRISLPSHLF